MALLGKRGDCRIIVALSKLLLSKVFRRPNSYANLKIPPTPPAPQPLKMHRNSFKSTQDNGLSQFHQEHAEKNQLSYKYQTALQSVDINQSMGGCKPSFTLSTYVERHRRVSMTHLDWIFLSPRICDPYIITVVIYLPLIWNAIVNDQGKPQSVADPLSLSLLGFPPDNGPFSPMNRSIHRVMLQVVEFSENVTLVLMESYLFCSFGTKL